MVLFTNVNLNQRVEVKRGQEIQRGRVKYKGCLVTQPGEWVGIALEEPVGNHDGMYKGRRYFQCKDGHGVFVRANSVRFIPVTRCLYDKYHSIDRSGSYVDETLFGTAEKPEANNGPRDPACIKESFYSTARDTFRDKSSMFDRPRSHHLRHSVGGTMPAATMRPQTAHMAFCYTSTPVHDNYYDDEEPFIASPSIPKIHMPYAALKRQVQRGWEGSHYVREMSVPTGRESIKFQLWNDVSA